MASQISHLALGINCYKYFCDKKEKDFFIGNNFPDIRLITNIKRGDTHFLSLNDFKDGKGFLSSDSPFYSGYKFHLLTDLIWKEYYTKNNNLFLKYGGFDKIKTPLILLEDSLFFNKIKDIKKYILFFNEMPEDKIESKLKIEKKKILQWYKIIQKYFLSNELNASSITKFRSNFSDYDNKELNEQLEILNILKNDNNIVDIINNFYNSFDDIIKIYIKNSW